MKIKMKVQLIYISTFLLFAIGCSESIERRNNLQEERTSKQETKETTQQSNIISEPLRDQIDKYFSYVSSKQDYPATKLLYNITFAKEDEDTIVYFDASKYMIEVIDSNIFLHSVFKEGSKIIVIRDQKERLGQELYSLINDTTLLENYTLDAYSDLVHDLSPPLPKEFKLSNGILVER